MKRGRLFLKVGVGLAAVFVVAVAIAYGWLRWAPRQVPAGQPPLATLAADSVSAVRDAFNAGDAEVRILAMLSPT
jgi:hypothetical protein